jgi:hypothetical protein
MTSNVSVLPLNPNKQTNTKFICSSKTITLFIIDKLCEDIILQISVYCNVFILHTTNHIENIVQTQCFVMNFWWDAFSHSRIRTEPVPNISANVLNIAACVIVVNENKKCYWFIDHNICIKWYPLYAYRCLNFSI